MTSSTDPSVDLRTIPDINWATRKHTDVNQNLDSDKQHKKVPDVAHDMWASGTCE